MSIGIIILVVFIAVPVALAVWAYSALSDAKPRSKATPRNRTSSVRTSSKRSFSPPECESQKQPQKQSETMPRDIFSPPECESQEQPSPSNVSRPLKNNGNRFVAIDFETANDRYYSACSLGIVVFERQQPVERKTFLINPPTKFDPINISIHGITEDMVKDAPTFDKIWPIIYPYLTNSKVVMYSDFDAKVLKSLIRKYALKPIGTSSIRLDCFDVCQAARDAIIGLTNYKLPTVCQYLGIGGLNHHEATSDAEACGKIYCWLYNHRGKVTNVTNDRPATYAQQDYIRNLGGVVPPVLSVREASMLIDKLIRENEIRKEEEYKARQAEREAKRVAEKEAREAEKLHKRRKKEEDALKLLADEMADPNYKARKSRSKRVQDLKEFQVLVNNVLADSVIEVDEILQIKAWLSDHVVLSDDFMKMFNLIDEVLADGKIDDVETQYLYEGLLDCMTTLRKRQA